MRPRGGTGATAFDLSEIGKPPEGPASAAEQAGNHRSSMDRVHQHTGAAKQQIQGSRANTFWKRLNDMDCLNEGMMFAAVAACASFPS